MITKRQLFLQHVGQTSELSMGFTIQRAEGVYLYDDTGKAYMDLNSGISVSSLGHGHPSIKKAINDQLDKHLHTMVYGEHIQSSQVAYATALCEVLPEKYNSLYYVLTGTEAIEAAMKLAKRSTGRTKIVAARHAYHGSTQGAESLRSDEKYKQAFYPLLPDIHWIDFNDIDSLSVIDKKTACVIIEPIQAEAGVIPPKDGFLQAVQEKCQAANCLFILDEIQTGFGRTGDLFATHKYGIAPDLICVGKAMGGGLPLAGILGPKSIINNFSKDPALGHISTFGGHPLSCAAGLAAFSLINDGSSIGDINEKSSLFKSLLDHEIVKEVRGVGLLMAVELTKRKYLKHVVQFAKEQGAIIDYFLFNDRSFRLAPPLLISEAEIKKACAILQQAFSLAFNKYK